MKKLYALVLSCLLSGCVMLPSGSPVPDSAPPSGAPISAVSGRTMRAVTIGLDRVDPEVWGGWSGDLSDCEFDATFAAQVWRNFGVPTTTLLTEQATLENVKAALLKSLEGLTAGDWLIVWLSGHGGQKPDKQGDETDGLDEYVCLYDGPVVDDTINEWLCTVQEGVRILWICDTCHSGTMHKRPPVFGPRATRDFKGQLILISGCAESGSSLSTGQGGVLSTALHDTGPEGTTPAAWAAAVRERIPRKTQVPQYVEYGQVTDDFRFGEIVSADAPRVSFEEILATPPEELVQSWWMRQKTAVLDCFRRLLKIPDPHAPEPGEAAPTDPAQPNTIPGERSTKVKGFSENGGKLVILHGCQRRWHGADRWNTHPSAKVMTKVLIASGPHTGETGGSYLPAGEKNGNRIHTRFKRPGPDYGDDDHRYTFTEFYKDGTSETFTVKDSRKQYNVF